MAHHKSYKLPRPKCALTPPKFLTRNNDDFLKLQLIIKPKSDSSTQVPCIKPKIVDFIIFIEMVFGCFFNFRFGRYWIAAESNSNLFLFVSLSLSSYLSVQFFAYFNCCWCCVRKTELKIINDWKKKRIKLQSKTCPSVLLLAILN